MENQPQVPDLSQSASRTVFEIILKTLSIRVATTLVAGHLGSLQHQPLQVHEFRALGFIALPSFPVTTLCANILRVVARGCIRRSSTQYLTSAALGVRCVSYEDTGGIEDSYTWRLLDVNEADIRREKARYDLRWAGRVLALLVFLAQAVAAVSVSLDRLRHGLQYFAVFDAVNALYLIGGIAAGAQCLAIHLCNWTWRWKRNREPVIPQWRTYLSSTEPSRHDLFYNRRRPLTGDTGFELDMSIFLTVMSFFPGRITTLRLLFDNTHVIAVSYNTHPVRHKIAILNMVVFACLSGVYLIVLYLDLLIIMFDKMRRFSSMSGWPNVWLDNFFTADNTRLVRSLGTVRAVTITCIFTFMCYTFVLELLDVGYCFDDEMQRCKWLSWKNAGSDKLWQF